MKGIVIVKPDANNVSIDVKTIENLYLAVKDFLFCTNDTCEDYILMRDNAISQIFDRASREKEYRGELQEEDFKIIGSNLEEKLNELNCDMQIKDIIIDGLKVLNFKIKNIKEFSLRPKDVDNIYQDKSGKEILDELHKYLDNCQVTIIMLEGNNMFLLQWWKSFVRKFLLKHRTDKYQLRNLIHVADTDLDYLIELINSLEDI